MAYRIDPKTGNKVEVDNLTGKPMGMDVNATSNFQQPITDKPEYKKVGGFWKSGLKFGKDIGSALINTLNPNLEKNTIVNVGRLGLAGLTSLIPGNQGTEEFAKPLIDSYKQRYSGGGKGIWEKIKDDPFSYASDAATVLSGGGALASKLGNVSKLSGLAKVGNVASKLGSAIDPLSNIGRVAKVTGVTKLLGKSGSVIDDIGKGISGKAIKTTPAKAMQFEDAIGMPFNKYAVNNGLTGNAAEITKKTKNLSNATKNAYKAHVTKTAYTNGEPLIRALQEEARIVKGTGKVPELLKDASYIEKQIKVIKDMMVDGKVPTNALLEMKGVSFRKFLAGSDKAVGQLAMKRIVGGKIIGHLDEYIPGSAKLGKAQQAAILAKEIVKKSGGNTGLKLGGVTGIGAKALGFGTGGIPGVIAAQGIESLANSPKFVSGVGGTVQKIGKGIQNLPSSKLGSIMNAAQTVSRGTAPLLEFQNGKPTFNQEQIQDTQTEQPIQGQQNIQMQQQEQRLPDGSIDVSKLKKEQRETDPEQDTATGYSVKQLSRAYAQLLMSGARKEASIVGQMLNLEQNYQKNNAPVKKKALSSNAALALNKVNTGVKTISDITETLKLDKNASYKRLNPLSQEGRRFEAKVRSAIDILGYMRTGATLTEEQAKTYRVLLPTFMDDEVTAKKKLDDLLMEFQGAADLLTGSNDTSTTFQDGNSPF